MYTKKFCFTFVQGYTVDSYIEFKTLAFMFVGVQNIVHVRRDLNLIHRFVSEKSRQKKIVLQFEYMVELSVNKVGH